MVYSLLYWRPVRDRTMSDMKHTVCLASAAKPVQLGTSLADSLAWYDSRYFSILKCSTKVVLEGAV